MDAATARFFAIGFPLLFVGMWLFVTTILGFASGWFSLQRRYPKGSGAPLRTFYLKSGSMGGFGIGGVSMNGILNLSPCSNGLRIGIFRLFGPFQRPFEVPWADIKVERKTLFFLPRAKLTFGTGEGTLSLGVGLWNRITAYAPNRDSARLAVEPASAQAVGAILLGLWAVVTALFGSFIAVTSRTGQGHTSPVPLAICYGMPAVVVGIAMFSLWIRQVR